MEDTDKQEVEGSEANPEQIAPPQPAQAASAPIESEDTNPFREMVDDWFREHYMNNFQSQNVEMANHNIKAKVDLLDRLGQMK